VIFLEIRVTESFVACQSFSWIKDKKFAEEVKTERVGVWEESLELNSLSDG
jgi:hypothetical protein